MKKGKEMIFTERELAEGEKFRQFLPEFEKNIIQYNVKGFHLAVRKNDKGRNEIWERADTYDWFAVGYSIKHLVISIDCSVKHTDEIKWAFTKNHYIKTDGSGSVIIVNGKCNYYYYSEREAMEELKKSTNSWKEDERMIELNKIYNEDCLEGIKDIPDKSIDLILTDPPYVNVVKEEWDKQNPFTYELVNELYRVCKDTGSIYVWCGIGEKSRSLLDFIPKLDSKFHFKDLITWKKQRGIGMRKGWLYTREECLWYVKNNKQFIWNKEEQYDVTDKRLFSLPNNKSDYKRWSNVWTDIKEVAGGMKSAQYHPTQKPIEAFERIIKLHTTNENNVILDCFMGSGTTAIACINTGRNFIGFELDKHYCDIANERIQKAMQDKATSEKGL